MITLLKRTAIASLTVLTLSAVVLATPASAAGGTWRGGHGGGRWHGAWGAAGAGLAVGALAGAALAAPYYYGGYPSYGYGYEGGPGYYPGYGNYCYPSESMYDGC